jgi:hypothetical protein
MRLVGLLPTRLIAAALVAAASVGPLAQVAEGHHGDTGEYDITQPLFVRGEVLEASYGFPHATLRVRVGPEQQVPADLSRYEPLTHLDQAPALDDLRVPQAGEIDVLLHPSITADTADPSSGRPEVGDTMEGIFVPRCPQGGPYDGEIRAVAFALGADGVSLRSDPDPTGYSEGCDDDAANASAPAGNSMLDRPAQQQNGGASAIWIAVGAIAVLVLAIAGLSIYRQREAR